MFVCQGVVRVGDRHQAVFHEGVDIQGQIARHLAHDDQIILVGDEALDHLLAVGHLEQGLDLRVFAQKPAERMRQEKFSGTHGADAQGPGHPALHVVNGAGEQLEAIRDLAAGGVNLLAGAGEKEFLADLLDQGHADAFPQTFDLDGDRRLGQMQFFRRAREAAVPRHRLEQAHLLQSPVMDHMQELMLSIFRYYCCLYLNRLIVYQVAHRRLTYPSLRLARAHH